MNDLREVDLERGMPRAEQAIRQMLFELRRSPGLGCSAVKLIHGYGSSGAGGRIRVEARRRLDRMKAGGEIWGYIQVFFVNSVPLYTLVSESAFTTIGVVIGFTVNLPAAFTIPE